MAICQPSRSAGVDAVSPARAAAAEIRRQAVVNTINIFMAMLWWRSEPVPGRSKTRSHKRCWDFPDASGGWALLRPRTGALQEFPLVTERLIFTVGNGSAQFPGRAKRTGEQF